MNTNGYYDLLLKQLELMVDDEDWPLGAPSEPVAGGFLLALFETSIAKMRVFRVPEFLGAALCVGAIVCIAAANAGATSQDLKTGYLVGATPIHQQTGLIIGVLAVLFVLVLGVVMGAIAGYFGGRVDFLGVCGRTVGVLSVTPCSSLPTRSAHPSSRATPSTAARWPRATSTAWQTRRAAGVTASCSNPSTCRSS